MPTPTATPDPHAQDVILGAGYVGARLAAQWPGAVCTVHAADPARPAARVFDLHDEATWRCLPPPGRVVWTFPATPLAAVERLHAAWLHRARQVIVLGSTRGYQVTTPGQWIDDATPLDLSQPRVVGEEFLRAQGATVLALAAIHGPGRSPAAWLRAGRIRNGAKVVNLIHVDDILATLHAVLATPQPGVRLCVSDGAPQPWAHWAAQLGLTLPDATPDTASKRVAIAGLRALLPPGYVFRGPDTQ